MTHCTFGGMLISDLINGKENKWEKIYSPSRFTLSKSGGVAKQILRETMVILKDLPNFNGSDELDTVNKGEGKVIEMLEEKFGVYRNPEGELYIVSAKCTHLKCTVAWNADELSWDCPCHGSRFTYEGKVINGPANFNLPAYRVAENKLETK
jgi:Rieske Fe-S protein